MKYMTDKIIMTGMLALIALTATTVPAQSLHQTALPKIEDPSIISIAYSPDGFGRISAADKNGKIRQYLEVWENQSKVPNVVTYVLRGDDGTAFTATWGRGQVNTAAFACNANKIPELGEKSLWVARVSEGVLTFQEIKDDDIKGLFENLTQARRDWNQTVNAANQRRNANLTQENILTLLKKKNREKWLAQGWLQLASSCVHHF